MENRYFFVIVTVVAVISIAAILLFLQVPHGTTNTQPSSAVSVITTNETKHIVPLEDIVWGGVPQDGIPSIDRPKFISASDAGFLKKDDLVIGVKLNGQSKAYPLFILVWHEIVNDKIGDTPVAVTYCPLCFTTQVFERQLNGTEVEFGTSGKLYNSNLVMYDRLTDSYWSQALGESITGTLAGTQLKRIPFDVARWSDWKSLYPDTEVLSTDTGYQRAYGSDPYGDYYTSSEIMFPVSHKDDRVSAKEVIVGYEDSEIYKAYKMLDIEDAKVINDNLGGKGIAIFSLYPEMVRAFDRETNGQTLEFVFSNDKIFDKQTNSEWSFDGKAVEGPMKGTQLNRITLNPGFWFEWVAFHPTTEIYQTG